MRNENFLPVIFSEASVRGTNRPVRVIGPRAFAAGRHGIRSGACRLSLRSFPKRTVASAAGECTRGRGAAGGERTGTAAAGRHCRCGSGGETAARSENLRTRRPKRSVYWIVFCNFVRFLPVRAAGAVRCAAGRRPRTNNNTHDKRYG